MGIRALLVWCGCCPAAADRGYGRPRNGLVGGVAGGSLPRRAARHFKVGIGGSRSGHGDRDRIACQLARRTPQAWADRLARTSACRLAAIIWSRSPRSNRRRLTGRPAAMRRTGTSWPPATMSRTDQLDRPRLSHVEIRPDFLDSCENNHSAVAGSESRTLSIHRNGEHAHGGPQSAEEEHK